MLRIVFLGVLVPEFVLLCFFANIAIVTHRKFQSTIIINYKSHHNSCGTLAVSSLYIFFLFIRISLINKHSLAPYLYLSYIELMNPIRIDQEKNKFVENIHGIDVYAPVSLYECQKMFVAYIIDCLNNKQNALVQSPTGTGKTLSLLCSTLSWVYAQQQNTKRQHRIIYTSRTHSQLNQVITELKRTNFNVKISQLASREHTCINEDLKQLSGHSKQLECRVRTLKKGGPFCKYYHHEEYYEKLPMIGVISDIEEVVTRGENQTFCPFFYQKNCRNKANLLLMPYNYLLDEKLIGQDLSALIKDSIIIFDEGHNIPSVCEQSQQLKINLQTIQRALNHISELRELSLKQQSHKQEDIGQGNLLKSIPSELQLHADYMSCLHSHLQTLNLPADEGGIVLNSKQFLQVLQKGTEHADQGPLKNNIEKLYRSSDSISSDTIFRPYWALESWLNFIKFLFEIYRQASPNQMSLEAKEYEKKAYQFQIAYQGSDIKLCLICLDPKIGFQKLIKNQPCSIILTSGTLTPLNSWPLQLQTNFAKALALPHILSKQQVNACIVTHGPDKLKMNFSFENRENKQMYKSLGQILLEIVTGTIGGVVILLPSYSVLEKLKNQLSNNGYLSKIYAKKAIFLQNKNASEFKSVLNSYFTECKKPKGAVFFALARGKISEGLDLSDEKCRALVMIGVPYPAVKDMKIKSKMSYLDQKNNQTKTITGNQWYICETIRCINQSIGRIIRHKNDYGSIYLIDERFKKSDIMSQISNWARECMKVYSDYQELIFKIEIFNKAMKSQEKQDDEAEAFFKSISGAELGPSFVHRKNQLVFPKNYDLSMKNDSQLQSGPKSNIDPIKQQEKVRESMKQDIEKAGEEKKNWNRQKMIFRGSFSKKLPTANEPPEDSRECPVCRYDRKLIKNSECQHQLCNDCWDIWLKKDLRCPICRVRVREKYLIK